MRPLGLLLKLGALSKALQYQTVYLTRLTEEQRAETERARINLNDLTTSAQEMVASDAMIQGSFKTTGAFCEELFPGVKFEKPNSDCNVIVRGADLQIHEIERPAKNGEL